MFSLLVLPLLLQATLTYGTWISVSNGGIWGTWGSPQRCPEGTFARGFSQRVEPDLGSGDDTGLNAIGLYCSDEANPTNFSIITSKQSYWGHWTPAVWCPSGYPLSFSLNVESERPHGDDTAANNLRMQCSDYTIIEGYGVIWGRYGAWSEKCTSGICGIQTKVEDPMGGDDTALNDVRFECCSTRVNTYQRKGSY